MEDQYSNCLMVENLKVGFLTTAGMITAVDGVDLTIRRKKITVLVGESGSGKSVTSLAIMNLLPSNGRILDGEITAEGIALHTLPSKKRQAYNGTLLGMIFQDPLASLDPLFTIGDQIMEGLRRHFKMSKKEALECAISYLEAMNLPCPEQLLRKYPYELSGGMCQRVMIAIALALKPSYLIADEPTTALDVTVQSQILSKICRLSQEKNMGVLFITHDLGVAAEIADDVCIMQKGKIVEQAEVDTIFHHPVHEYTKKLLNGIL